MISTLQHIRLLAPPGPDTRQKLRTSLIYAYSNFTTYRDLFETAFVGHEVLVGDDPFAVLERLPVISADTLARVSEESLAIVDGIVDMETSSGTTGVRKKRFISHEDDRDDHNFMAELFRVAGISAHDRVACLDTDPVYLMVSFARALDTLGVDESYVYSVGRDQGQTLDALVRLDPTAIFAVPSMFERCWPPLRRLYDAECTGSLRMVVFLGERVPHRLRAQLESEHGIEVFSYYGAAETSSLGIECTAHTGIHLYTDRNLFELTNTNNLSPTGEEMQTGVLADTNNLSPAGGEIQRGGLADTNRLSPTGEEMQTGARADTNSLSPTGEEIQRGGLVVTSLVQKTVPLVRYALGDEIVQLPGKCPCGLLQPLVDVLGRAGDSFSVLGSTAPLRLAPALGLQEVRRGRLHAGRSHERRARHPHGPTPRHDATPRKAHERLATGRPTRIGVPPDQQARVPTVRLRGRVLLHRLPEDEAGRRSERRREIIAQVFFIALAILSGAGISMQAAMLGAVGTARTPAAAVWISLLATVVGLTSFVIYRSATSSIGLPPPFDRPYIMIAFAIAATVALAFSARDIEWYYVLTGLMPIPFLVGAGFLAPRLGVGLYISAAIAGQLTAAVLLDHIGAFGGNLIRADYIRLAGIAALMTGVVLIRGFR